MDIDEKNKDIYFLDNIFLLILSDVSSNIKYLGVIYFLFVCAISKEPSCKWIQKILTFTSSITTSIN